MKEAGFELDTNKQAQANPHLTKLVDDYKTTRDTIRACMNPQNKL